MKKIIYCTIALMALLLAACSTDEPVYNNLPAKITEFISEYYPNEKVDSYQAIASGYQVVVNDGPTIDFDKAYSWTMVDGNGSTLPQQMLYDQLPNALYQYLDQTETLGQVFSISRDTTKYTVALLKSTVTYTIATGNIDAQ